MRQQQHPKTEHHYIRTTEAKRADLKLLAAYYGMSVGKMLDRYAAALGDGALDEPDASVLRTWGKVAQDN